MDLIDAEELSLARVRDTSVVMGDKEFDSGEILKHRMDVPAEFVGPYKILDKIEMFAVGYQSREYLYPEYFSEGDEIILGFGKWVNGVSHHFFLSAYQPFLLSTPT